MVLSYLTNEKLRKLFKNNFDLCNFAINIGRNMVLSGSGAGLDDVIKAVEARTLEARSEES